MTADRTEAIDTLLMQAEEAHGIYEGTDLNGVYDQDWPRWYAAYAVEHGIGTLVGHEVTTDALAAFLATSNAEFQRAERTPAEPWAAYTAQRIAAEL
ncbi:MAG: hypothetical protein M3R49_12270 [Chloroflexota bacterium]|nr:hypothetical protein [Chloroflexota bacterium]MDQ2940583.1 hypothetical protein [Chloroflexota bacterium]